MTIKPEPGRCPHCGLALNSDGNCPLDEPDIIDTIDDAVENGVEKLDAGLQRLLRR